MRVHVSLRSTTIKYECTTTLFFCMNYFLKEWMALQLTIVSSLLIWKWGLPWRTMVIWYWLGRQARREWSSLMMRLLIDLLQAIVHLNNNQMSSFEFDFDFQPQTRSRPSNRGPNVDFFNKEGPDLVEIMAEIDHKSIDFQNFDEVDNNPHQVSKSSFSRQASKKSEPRVQSGKSREDSRYQLDNSRNINEISILENSNNRSFRYEGDLLEPRPSLQSNNDRYNNLQRLLNKAKTNSLDQFYRNLDQQNAYASQQLFKNKQQFKEYRNNLKEYKRSLEEQYRSQNGNYNFAHNQYKYPQQQAKAGKGRQFNFKKKEVGDKYQSQFNFFSEDPPNPKSNNFLPHSLNQEDDGLDFYLEPEEVKRQIERHQQKRSKKQGFQFFTEQQMKKRGEKPTKKLEIINEEKANIFENTQEEEKMNKLLNNYNQLKSNFNELITNFKDTNYDKEKITHEIERLKMERENKQSRLKVEEQNKREKRLVKEREKEDKAKTFNEIKEKINKISQKNEKDVLILKLNQKVQTLEDLLKNAIQQLNQEKQPKLIPKIINYYNEPSPRLDSQRSRTRFQNEINFSGQQGIDNLNSSNTNKLEEFYLGSVRNAIRQLKQQKREDTINNLIDDFSSPLQLDLTVQDPLSLSRGRSQQFQQTFIPADRSKEYLPNPLDSNNKYLRRCLTQKSSILFESFEFYIAGKFTMTGNEQYPVTCEVRVANRCAINLYDVFVIVYGPQAQESELQMRPAKIMYDEFKYNTSFLFEVDLSKICIESGSFNIQISYKSDSVNKKKVNFKAILPFVQLIKPEFIYEEQFMNAWNHMEEEFYVKPKPLDFKNIRSHEDLKLILPFIEINQPDCNSFSYGIMFNYPKSATTFMLKVTCYVSGKASVHLKSSQANQSVDKRLRQQILDIMCYLIFG